MKYVITDLGELVIGSKAFHADLAKSAQGNVVAAGHVDIVLDSDMVRVHGSSIGYGIPAKEDDALVIAEAFAP